MANFFLRFFEYRKNLKCKMEVRKMNGTLIMAFEKIIDEMKTAIQDFEYEIFDTDNEDTSYLILLKTNLITLFEDDLNNVIKILNKSRFGFKFRLEAIECFEGFQFNIIVS